MYSPRHPDVQRSFVGIWFVTMNVTLTIPAVQSLWALIAQSGESKPQDLEALRSIHQDEVPNFVLVNVSGSE